MSLLCKETKDIRKETDRNKERERERDNEIERQRERRQRETGGDSIDVRVSAGI